MKTEMPMHELLKMAYEEGENHAAVVYEEMVEKMGDDICKLRQKVNDLQRKIAKQDETIERQKKVIERQDLPYDAMGDYSHHPEPNRFTRTESFSADEWYRETFGQ